MWKFLQRFFRLFFKGITLRGVENIPDSPYIVVANHLASKGPILLLSYWPHRLYPWIIWKTITFKTAINYISKDFVEKELKIKGFLSIVISFLISLIAIPFLKAIGCIPVYSGSKKIKLTIDISVSLLLRGKNIVIFSEDSLLPSQDGIHKFRNGFLEIAKRYVKITNKPINIVPVFLSDKEIVIAHSYVFGYNYTKKNIYVKERSSVVRKLEEVIRSLKTNTNVFFFFALYRVLTLVLNR